ncbi:hypothetical protein [Shewanella sp. ENK2]|uniref:hypothetical protein n=1 Tax=Shewanella sp. ENK2 TaxID=2775245 RepID=UPI0037497630
MNKTHVYCFLLTIVNLIFHESPLGLIISVPQIIFMCFLLVTNKEYDKILYFHIMFVFTTLAIPYSQLTNPGEGSMDMYNYSRLKLLGPLAFSQLLLVGLIGYGILKNGIVRVSPKSKPLSYLLIYFLLSGAVLSFYGLAFNEYSFIKMLTYFVYISVLVLTLVSVLMLKNTEKIYQLLYSLLLMAPIASVSVYLLGFSSSYGSSTVPGMTEVAYFSPILIYKMISERKISYLEVFSVLCCIYLASTGASGGKGIIVILAVIVLSLITKVTIKRITVLSMLVLGFLLMLLFVSYDELYEFNSLLLYKLESVWLLFNFIFSFNMDMLGILPMSPRVRVIELYLIFQENGKSIVYFLFGQGFGGWYQDTLGYFSGIDLSSAFSENEIRTGRFHSAHDFFAILPFFHGIFGVFFMGGIHLLCIKNKLLIFIPMYYSVFIVHLL